jgi:hypothetical protein
MTPKLSDELRQAVANHPGQPVQVEDPITHARYVLVELGVYEQLQRAMDYDTSDPSPRDFYPLVDRVMQEDDAHDPALESYQHLTPDQRTP